MNSNQFQDFFNGENTDFRKKEDEFLSTYTLREYNFKLNNELHQLIVKKLEDTLELAPSNACTIVCISKDNLNYKGSINISSYFISFESIAEAEEPYDLVKTLCRDIRHQLRQWKKQRFSQASLGPESYLQAV